MILNLLVLGEQIYPAINISALCMGLSRHDRTSSSHCVQISASLEGLSAEMLPIA